MSNKADRFQTRDNAGSLEWKDPKTGAWRPAVYHDTIRGQLIQAASALGQYVHPRQHGQAPDDVTSFLQSQARWGHNRANRPDILYQFEPRDNNLTGRPGGYWYHDGRIVITREGRPVLDYPEIPATCSSQMEGWLMEAIVRLNAEITAADFRARMPRPGAPEVNALSMRRTRFREVSGAISWKGGKGSDNIKAWMLSKLPQSCIDENSTRNFRDLTSDEARECHAANQGQFPERARREKRLAAGMEVKEAKRARIATSETSAPPETPVTSAEAAEQTDVSDDEDDDQQHDDTADNSAKDESESEEDDSDEASDHDSEDVPVDNTDEDSDKDPGNGPTGAANTAVEENDHDGQMTIFEEDPGANTFDHQAGQTDESHDNSDRLHEAGSEGGSSDFQGMQESAPDQELSSRPIIPISDVPGNHDPTALVQDPYLPRLHDNLGPENLFLYQAHTDPDWRRLIQLLLDFSRAYYRRFGGSPPQTDGLASYYHQFRQLEGQFQPAAIYLPLPRVTHISRDRVLFFLNLPREYFVPTGEFDELCSRLFGRVLRPEDWP